MTEEEFEQNIEYVKGFVKSLNKANMIRKMQGHDVEDVDTRNYPRNPQDVVSRLSKLSFNEINILRQLMIGQVDIGGIDLRKDVKVDED